MCSCVLEGGISLCTMHFGYRLFLSKSSFSWEAKQHQVYLNSNTQQIQQMQHLHHKQLEVISAHPIGIAGSPWYRNSAWWMTPLELVRGSSNVSVWDPTVPPWYQRPSECAADIPRWLHPDLACSRTALLAATFRNPSYKPMMMERPNLMGWLQWKNASSLS